MSSERHKQPGLVATAEEQAQAEQALQQVVTLQAQIDNLRAQQTLVSGTFWSLPARSADV